MAWQVIKQPNGKLCIFSSISDTFLLVDGTEQDIVDFFVEDAVESAKDSAKQVIQRVKEMDKPYYQFTMDFADAVKKHLRKSPHRNEFYKFVVEQMELVKNKG